MRNQEARPAGAEDVEPLPEMHMTEAGAAISQKAEAKDGVPIPGVEDEESRPPETDQGRGATVSAEDPES